MKAIWRPFFWEPVAGTGERLMAGVVLFFDNHWACHRMLRDDVLDGLYGKAAANPRKLLEESLGLLRSIAEAGGVEALAAIKEPLMGLHPGALRSTDAATSGEALRQVVLLHSSMAQLDGWDDMDESDAPAAEEVNKRFATEVRDSVIALRPELVRCFGRSASLIREGRPVRFGFLSESAVLHFSVVHPVRQAASVRDARARLWELSRAQATGMLNRAALISWLPSEEDPTIGAKQRAGLRSVKFEMEREADDVGMKLFPVQTIQEATHCVLETV
jgi:hypothetical protein